MKNFKTIILLISISLGFSLCGKSQTFINSNKLNSGPVFLIAGISFTTASILQNSSEGYYVSTYSNYTGKNTVTYVRPNILTNSPVNVMFGVGVVFTIGGTYSWIRSGQ